LEAEEERLSIEAAKNVSGGDNEMAIKNANQNTTTGTIRTLMSIVRNAQW